MREKPTLVWFRHDLRLEDNDALRTAAEGGPVVPVFIWSPDEEGDWTPGAASRWWLHQSLRSLDADLHRLHSRLILRSGDALSELTRLVEETGAATVYWNRRYEPAAVKRDAWVEVGLRSIGVNAESFGGGLLYEPGEVRTRQGNPFRVFTPFWKALRALPPPREPALAPSRLRSPGRWCRSLKLQQLGLEPEIDWADGLREAWQPGEAGARANLDHFLGGSLGRYAKDRDRPDHDGTSRLSPHLHFGEISPRTVWHAANAGSGSGREVFLKELAWREFAHHQLAYHPDTPDHPLREEFASFPRRHDKRALRAWQRGRTGYPLVDAGMRQLWATGWMHNRVRMVVASFLVKHLLLPWQDGARWFWDTLVDADLANNTLNWQWVAGCGADAAPFFRIFNPVLQGMKFDPAGEYIRAWVPELSALPAPWIHKPWRAPAGVLEACGVRLGETYPAPIVDHHQARGRALDAFKSIATGAKSRSERGRERSGSG